MSPARSSVAVAPKTLGAPSHTRQAPSPAMTSASTLSGPTLEPQQVLAGRYRIESVLARGGFSVIYLATRLNVGDTVVVKVLHHDAMRKDPAAAERFRREAAIAMEIRHPSHVTVYDYGATPDGQPFLVLERLHGRELTEVFKTEAPLSAFKVRLILRQILVGLAELHAHGVAHRDLKPPNVFVCEPEDEDNDASSTAEPHVKLIDYGLAKVLSADHPVAQANLTIKDIVVGTPGYLAPELLAGESTTTLVDLYAAGIIGYELLTGRRAYEGTLMDRAVAQSRGNPPPPPPAITRSPLWPVIDKLLARDPAERYPDALAAIDALDALELKPTKSGPTALRRPPGAVERLRGIALFVIGVAAVAVAVYFALDYFL